VKGNSFRRHNIDYFYKIFEAYACGKLPMQINQNSVNSWI
jgi:hypothetical protein